MSTKTGPLSSVKVLDLTMLLPGPLCTQHLGDMGAEIIKVENPKVPDLTRYMGKGAGPDGSDGVPHLFNLLNRNKKTVTVNLKRPEGKEIIHKLLSECDILVEGFRPGAMAKMGLGPEELCEKFPRLIYCSISGYGASGPYINRAGHDGNYISYAGILGITGDSEGRPVLPGVQIADIAGGTLTALSGILAALYSREKTDEGQYIDVSMTDGAFAMMGLHLGSYLADKKLPEAGNMMLSGMLPNYNVYQSSDGQWLMLGALEERFLRSFLRSQGCEERLKDYADKGLEHPDSIADLKAFLKELFAAKPMSYWNEHCSNPDICLSPVLNIEEVLENEQLQNRGMVIKQIDENGDDYPAIGSPFKFSRTPVSYGQDPRPHGADSDDVLSSLGFSSDEIEELRKKRIV